MLRISYKTVFKQSNAQQQHLIRQIYLSSSKNTSASNRQAKLFNKLFGERVSGSKKHWFPSVDTGTTPKRGGNLFLSASQIGKPGKNTARRSAVLNKLFMEEISSLLATGAIADHFLGRGLQLTRVKIAPHFTFLNVYWMGTGDPIADEKLSEDLQSYSGLLRHELSQLRVMGEVPRIHFVQDKTLAGVEHVEALLRTLNLSQDVGDDSNEEQSKIDFRNGAAARIKEDFYGNRQQLENAELENHDKILPPMRHDVFGLDHHGIMLKILAKMKKSKEAWEKHEQQDGVLSVSSENSVVPEKPSMLKEVEQKIAEFKTQSSEDFAKFLAQRRDRKNTPERKKYRKTDDISLIDAHNEMNSGVVESKKYRDFFNQEDYLSEEHENERKL